MERWILWNTVSIPTGQYELIKVQYDCEGLKLLFDDEKILIEVTYGNEVLAFRCCDEGDRWKTVDSVLSKYGADFFKGKLFFKVENSEFKEWFEKEKFGILTKHEFIHYAFVTQNDIVDVLALNDPVIKITFQTDN